MARRARPGGVCFSLLALLLCLTACRSAGQVVEDRFIAPERFEIRVPSPVTWELVKNRRSARRTEVVYRRRGGGAWLRVRVTPEASSPEELPLDVLAHQVFLKELQLDGGRPELETMARLMIDEREAIAFTGSRYERPKRWSVSTIVIRSQGYLVTLGYWARPELFEPLAGEFERLLRHFKVLLPGYFDPYLLEELPMGAPGPSPGNQRPPRPAKPAAPRVPRSPAWPF